MLSNFIVFSLLEVDERVQNARDCLSVAVGVMRKTHVIIGGLIAEKPRGFRHDHIGVGPDQAHRTRRNRFRAFGRVAHDKHWLAKRGRLFLNPPESVMIR